MELSELQIGLVGLGVVTVAGIWGVNAWQARRHRRLAESLLKRDSNDALLARQAEATGEAAATAGTPAAASRIEPTLGALAEPPASLAEPAAVAPVTGPSYDELPLPPNLLSYAADYIASFEMIEAEPAETLLREQSGIQRGAGKRVAWVGLNEIEGAWEFCRPGVAYRRLRVGVQLADRRGPLAEPQLQSFHAAMQHLADERRAVLDLPPRQAALETAQSLDRICAGVDIQVGVNVVSKGAAFAGTKIRALAEAAGMVIEADGSFVRRDDDGNLLYTLHAHDGVGFSAESMRTMSVHGLTFLLDVPRVAHGDRVFNQMLDVARRFAEALPGQVVDDNRRPLTEQLLTPIRKQIGQYQATMANHGLPAGSDVARRLFS